jgi:hypothetical protein
MEQIQNLITGLKASLVELREREKIFIKSQTLQEQADKARTACDKLEDSLEVVKKTKTDLKEKRAEILKSALDPLAESITALLPRGEGVVTLDEKLFIGWKEGERLVPYGGMSSGEKVPFDSALSRALLKGEGLKIIVLEGAEEDENNLLATLEKILQQKDPSTQWIVNTCYPPKETPEGWKLVKL